MLGAGIGGGGGAPAGLPKEPGRGGEGGAALVGMGGGGGAPKLGIGGGGRGALSSLEDGGIGGAGGGAEGVDGLPKPGDLDLSSMADNGLGGAMVPNNIEASCLALPPVGLSSSLSSLSEELSSVESTTDHSSSSGRWRDGRESVGVEVRGAGWDFVAASLSCCAASRWKGFVDTSAGDVIEDAGCVEGVAAASFAWLSFLKKGFFVSLLIEDDGPLFMGASEGLAAADSDGVNVAGAAGSGADGLLSRDSTWLLVGVVSCGVISCGPSSSEDDSSPSASSCNCSCLSRSFAASISARCAASLASFSFASFSAACFLRFSSCFFIFPCLTCCSNAFSRAADASLSLASSSSWP